MCFPSSKVTQSRTTARPFKMGRIYFPEMSVNKYQNIPRNFPEERAYESGIFQYKLSYVHLISYWTKQEVPCQRGTPNSMTGLQNRHLNPVQSMPTFHHQYSFKRIILNFVSIALRLSTSDLSHISYS